MHTRTIICRCGLGGVPNHERTQTQAQNNGAQRDQHTPRGLHDHFHTTTQSFDFCQSLVERMDTWGFNDAIAPSPIGIAGNDRNSLTSGVRIPLTRLTSLRSPRFVQQTCGLMWDPRQNALSVNLRNLRVSPVLCGVHYRHINHAFLCLNRCYEVNHARPTNVRRLSNN